MNRLIYIALLTIMAACGNSPRANQSLVMESISMHSSILRQEIKYSIVLPDDYYSSGKSYPVVYMLHGLGDNESSWLEYGRIDHYVKNKTQSDDISPMIYVMPQGFRTYYVNDYKGLYRYQDMFIKELIPHIDSAYRTIADKNHRATIGYSMGGFGALILPLKNPDVISISVPLSISIRTDKQYMAEESPWWDDQWGRLFGGENKKDTARITEYYKQNNPFYIFADKSNVPDIKIYIDNGDDEETLCYSNEELHLLMLKNGIPHEFRVRNGGHSFLYWYSALDNALPFISDAFEGKAYRGNKKASIPTSKVSPSQWKTFNSNGNSYRTLVPCDYDKTTRLYPTLYLLAKLNDVEQSQLASMVQGRVSSGELPPFNILFCSDTATQLANVIIPAFEQQFRARPGYRFRSIVGCEEGGKRALYEAQQPSTFASCISINANIDTSDVRSFIVSKEEKKKPFNDIWLYINVPENSAYANGNSHLHMDFKSAGVKHEYRVQESSKNNFDYLMQSMSQSLPFISNGFHR